MIDLHVHSTFSDGTMTPEELIDEAEALSISALALTDHDSTNGVERFVAAAEGRNVQAISGVEISAEFKPGTLHMLGYFVDHTDKSLNDHLEWIRTGRETRNKEILHRLVELGFHLTWKEVASYAGEDVIGRPHFARALIEHGYVKDTQEAFDRYLARGKPGYAERRRLAPEDCIELIRQAGGLPVLAHAFTLGLKKLELRKLLNFLRDVGLEGLEVYYSEHTPEMQRTYAKLARDYGLVPTGGTDYHGAASPDLKLGSGFGNLNISHAVVDAMEARRAGLFGPKGGRL